MLRFPSRWPRSRYVAIHAPLLLALRVVTLEELRAIGRRAPEGA